MFYLGGGGEIGIIGWLRLRFLTGGDLSGSETNSTGFESFRRNIDGKWLGGNTQTDKQVFGNVMSKI